jgi:hypothetical protein
MKARSFTTTTQMPVKRCLAGTGPDAQTFAVPENSQDVIGKLSLRFWSVKPTVGTERF